MIELSSDSTNSTEISALRDTDAPGYTTLDAEVVAETNSDVTAIVPHTSTDVKAENIPSTPQQGKEVTTDAELFPVIPGASYSKKKFGTKQSFEPYWTNNPRTLEELLPELKAGKIGYGIMLGNGFMAIDVDKLKGCEHFVRYFGRYPMELETPSWYSGKCFDGSYSSVATENNRFTVLVSLSPEQEAQLPSTKKIEGDIEFRVKGVDCQLPSLSPHQDTGNPYFWHRSPNTQKVMKMTHLAWNAILSDLGIKPKTTEITETKTDKKKKKKQSVERLPDHRETLEDLMDEFACAKEGVRTDTLNKLAFWIGLRAHFLFNVDGKLEALKQVALDMGFTESKATSVISSGFGAGQKDAQDEKTPTIKPTRADDIEWVEDVLDTGSFRLNVRTIQYEWEKEQIDLMALFLMHTKQFSRMTYIREDIYTKTALVYADKDKYDPVYEMFESLPPLPAGYTPKLNNILARCFGNTDEFANLLVKLWFIGMVARVYNPGCKMDNLLLLNGIQGLGKSTFFEKVGGEYYVAPNSGQSQTDFLLGSQAGVVVELSEIEGVFSTHDIAQLKAMITTRRDQIRKPYGRSHEWYPRRGVFCGTTNKETFLADNTGNRRFWVVKVLEMFNEDLFIKERTQILQEAIQAYKSGEQWYLTQIQEAMLARRNREFQTYDPQEDPLKAFYLVWKSPKYSQYLITSQVILEKFLNMKADKAGMTKLSILLKSAGLLDVVPDKRRVNGVEMRFKSIEGKGKTPLPEYLISEMQQAIRNDDLGKPQIPIEPGDLVEVKGISHKLIVVKTEDDLVWVRDPAANDVTSAWNYFEILKVHPQELSEGAADNTEEDNTSNDDKGGSDRKPKPPDDAPSGNTQTPENKPKPNTQQPETTEQPSTTKPTNKSTKASKPTITYPGEPYPTPKYTEIDTDKGLALLCDSLKLEKTLGIDTETTGLSPHTDKIRLVQLAVAGKNPTVFIIDLPKISDTTPLKELLAMDTILKVGQNLKFDIGMLRQAGFDVGRNIFDTMIAAQLLEAGISSGQFSLGALASRYVGASLDKTEQKGFSLTAQLSEKQLVYAAIDAAIVLELWETLRPRIKHNNLTAVAKIEFEAIPAVAEMQFSGMKIDAGRWREMEQAAKAEAHRYKDILNIELPDVKNPNSQKQLMAVFKKLNIPADDTSQDTLKRLAADYPVLKPVLLYKKREKHASFLAKLPTYINEDTGNIHTSFNQLGAKTGRSSSSDPNIQQIPRGETRTLFVASPGCKLIKADYSQVELRIVAEMSGDQIMIEAYRNEGDLHKRTASLILGKSMGEVTKADRQIAKAINFGLAYGMSAKTLKEYAFNTYEVELTDQEAERFRMEFFRGYPGLQAWHENTRTELYRGKNETRTLANRRCSFAKPYLHVLLNYPVQGTSADITKKALGVLPRALAGTGAKIIAVVHDEIVLDCPEATAETAAGILKQEMEDAGNYYLKKVPCEVEVVIADNWGG